MKKEKVSFRVIVIVSLLLAVSFSVNTPCSAQSERGIGLEFLVSGGGGSFLIMPRATDEDHGKLGFSAAAELRYTPVKWITFGASAGRYNIGTDDADKRIGFGFDVLLNWLNRNKFKMYSGVGYKFSDSIENGIQFIPIGAAYGGKVFGFAEIGSGGFFFPARCGIGVRF